MVDSQVLQAVPQAPKGGLGVSSAHLLASPFSLNIKSEKRLKRNFWFGASEWNL